MIDRARFILGGSSGKPISRVVVYRKHRDAWLENRGAAERGDREREREREREEGDAL